MGARTSTWTVVVAALLGDLLVALSKTAAAFLSGSSAMTSEAVHSFVDVVNDLLLLYGMHRSRLPPDGEHPIGYGRELYFWSFVVSLLVLSLGAGAAVMQGADRLRNPVPIENAVVNYVVIAVAFVFEAASFGVALVQYRQVRRGASFLDVVRTSKNPPAVMVLTEGGAALLGLAFAAAGTWASTSLGWHAADGLASLLIGVVLGVVSTVVARQTKNLLIGQAADPRLGKAIERLATQDPRVISARTQFTVQLAPDQVAAALAVQFLARMETGQIEAAVAQIEGAIRQAHPQVVSVLVTPQANPGTGP